MNFMNLIFFVMKKIGILGFQGAIIEHERQIKAIGHEPVIVKYPEQLEEIDGIILPGGESTTMGNACCCKTSCGSANPVGIFGESSASTAGTIPFTEMLPKRSMTTPWTTCVILYAQWSAGIRQTDFLRYPQQGGEMTGKALRQYRTKSVW